MKENFESSLIAALKSEGGFVNHHSDPGGATNLGVTKKVWEAWIGKQVTVSDMRNITCAQVSPLYKKQYWDAVRGDDLPSGLDYLVFDFAINAGVSRAIKTLQKALSIVDDGVFGNKTLDAVNKADSTDLIIKFSDLKEQFYKSLPTFSVFGKGWMRRVAEAKTYAQTKIV